jgi:hypothetical protein
MRVDFLWSAVVGGWWLTVTEEGFPAMPHAVALVGRFKSFSITFVVGSYLVGTVVDNVNEFPCLGDLNHCTQRESGESVLVLDSPEVLATLKHTLHQGRFAGGLGGSPVKVSQASR